MDAQALGVFGEVVQLGPDEAADEAGEDQRVRELGIEPPAPQLTGEQEPGGDGRQGLAQPIAGELESSELEEDGLQR